MDKKIYIQIPAYRDSELQPTLYDLIKKANDKDRLRIAVAWQHHESEKLDTVFNKRHKIEIIDVPMESSRGCNWARSLLQERWMGEAFTLFLDSHHRFVKGWDDLVIEMYEDLAINKDCKPIVSGYLPDYYPKTDNRLRGQRPLRIEPFKREQGLLFYLRSKELNDVDLISLTGRAQFTSLHFLFTHGVFNEVVEFDPSIYFFADEVAISLRAYTKGYDIFHPHRVLGWHLYDRRSTRIPHWKDHSEWRQQNAFSISQLFKLFGGEKHGRFGIGTERTVSEYEKYIGMKLIEKSDYNNTVMEQYLSSIR